MTERLDSSLQLTTPADHLGVTERIALALAGLGALALLVAALGGGYVAPGILLGVSLGSLSLAAFLYTRRYLRRPAGIDNDGVMHRGLTARGAAGWILAVVLTGSYVILYWWPGALDGLIRIFDGPSQVLRGGPSDQWFTYGALYTLAVVVMGVRALAKYRHDRYHVWRTVSVMFFQLGFAFLIPYMLVLLNEPEFYFSYFWPLKYDYLWPGNVGYLVSHPGRLGAFMVFWGAVMIVIATPILTYFYGKRWYCSWVCGCGGLANTAGDPFRHLSDKSLRAWKIERWMVHGVLVFVVITTAMLWINSATEGWLFGSSSHMFASIYGFLIGLVFAGVVGVGFYPLMGTRVWCRFGCPMAAILGIQQRFFSRFRITTNGGQCISCGNCSTYCEMGIDVRWYAQRGQNVIRASCVGCGICSAVCPRGVLRLENGPRDSRFNGPVLIDRDQVMVLTDDVPASPAR
jgi:ferredoxin-type protein NapH